MKTKFANRKILKCILAKAREKLNKLNNEISRGVQDLILNF